MLDSKETKVRVHQEERKNDNEEERSVCPSAIHPQGLEVADKIRSKGNINTENENKKVSSRSKKECPHPSCDKIVTHLPRHLRLAHKWSPRKAKAAVQKFGLRKTKDDKVGDKKRDYHVKKICPLPGCRSVVRRIADHLTGKHKLSRTSFQYKKALKDAMKAPVGEHVFTKLKKDRLDRQKLLSCEFDETNPELEHAVIERTEQDITEMKCTELDDDTETKPTEQDATETEATSRDATELAEEVDTDLEERPEIKATVPTTTSKHIQSFKMWLLSPDGGKNDEKTASQHSTQLSKVVSIIDPDDSHISSLFDYKLIGKKFITEYAEPKYYPKTIKSYIMSVRHFYTYVLTDNPEDIHVDDKDLLIATRERLKRWSNSYKKVCNRRQWEKKEEDLERIVTPAIVNEFERSKAARDAIIFLGKLSGAHNVEVGQRDFTLVRDFLMAEVSIDNANRAGVLANMTVEEFRKAKSTKDGESVVVKVMKHKTSDTKGPANVVLSTKLHGWMKVYMDECRSQVVNNAQCLHVFLSWNGHRLESCQIAKALKSVFKKANIDVQITSNYFRKGAVTEVHDNHKEYKSSLAVLLDHDESTATKHYRLSEKEKTAVIASKKLASAMRSSKPDPQEHTKTDDNPQDHTKSDDDPQDHTKTDDVLPSVKQSSADKWNAEQMKILTSVFAQEIEEQKITIVSVREKVKGIKDLEDKDAREILQKVRSQWRFPRQQRSSGNVIK